MDHTENAARHRKQADECRTIGEMMKDEETRQQYFRLAEAYEKLAENEDKIANNVHEIDKLKPDQNSN